LATEVIIKAKRINFKEMKMNTDNSNDQVSRRGFLGVSSAALAAAVGALSVSSAIAQNQTTSHNTSGDRTKSDPGPANPPLDGQIRIPSGRLRPIRKASSKISNIRFLSPTSASTKAAGPAKSPFANCPSPKL
jgi:hypothetical protein